MVLVRMREPTAPAHRYYNFTFTAPCYELNIINDEALEWFKSESGMFEVGGKSEKKTIFEQTITKEEKKEIPKEIKGDLNGDGKFDSSDLKIAGEALARGKFKPKK